MKIYEFSKEQIKRIEIAFDGPDGDEDYCPFCLLKLRRAGFLTLEELLQLKDELEDMVVENIRSLSIEDVIMKDYLENAECAIECLYYVKDAYDNGAKNDVALEGQGA